MRISDWSSDVCSSDLRGHSRTNFKATGLSIAVEQLRGQRVGERDQRHVGPLAKRHANRQRPIGGQVAGKAVGNRLAEFLVLDLLHVFVAVLGLLVLRSEEHTSELQSLMRISYAVFCLKKNNTT